MASINWIFLCDYAYVDAAGKASIIGIWEHITAKQLPLVWPQMYVVLDIIPDPTEEMKVGVILSSPSSMEIARIDGAKIKVPDNRAGFANHAVLAFGFFKLNFTEAGVHHIELLFNEVSIHSIAFTIQAPKAI
jgi:hypothetical protein